MHYEQTTFEDSEIVVVSEDIFSAIMEEWIDYYLEKYKIGGLKSFDNDFELHSIGDLMFDGYDSYGSTEAVIIKRKSDEKLFGFAYYQGGGKYGEQDYDSNGSEFGFESHENEYFNKKHDDEMGNREWISYYVFQEVEPKSMVAWAFAK